MGRGRTSGQHRGEDCELVDDEVKLVLLSEESRLYCKDWRCETQVKQELVPLWSRISDIHKPSASVATDVRCGRGPRGDGAADYFGSDAPAAGAADDRRESIGRLLWETVRLVRRVRRCARARPARRASAEPTAWTGWKPTRRGSSIDCG